MPARWATYDNVLIGATENAKRRTATWFSALFNRLRKMETELPQPGNGDGFEEAKAKTLEATEKFETERLQRVMEKSTRWIELGRDKNKF